MSAPTILDDQRSTVERRSPTDVTHPRPQVYPSRRHLDWRFPSVALTVATDLPWVEVLLATDPARVRDRTADTFYASRTDGGLTPTVAGRCRYVAPAAVVDRLAVSGSLWYLAVAFDDASGQGGVASAAAGASGVITVDGAPRGARHRTARRRSLGVSLTGGPSAADDRRAGEDGADALSAATVTAPTLGLRRRSSTGTDVTDRRAGEDGADLARGPVAAIGAPAPVPTVPVAPPIPAASEARPPAPPASPPSVPPPTHPTHAGDDPAPREHSPASLSLADYTDGWEELDRRRVPALASGPALGDEYPDIERGDLPGRDPYGPTPAYLSLEGEPAPGAASSPSADATPTPEGSAPPAGTRPRAVLVLPSLDLPPETQRRVIEATTGGDASAYSAVNADGAYRGRHGPGHKAYHRFHTGLGFGIADFGQDSGLLGQVLALMNERDPATFAAVFGPAASALLETTNAPGPSGEHVDGDRGPRVRPVDGVDLWEEPWLSRFRAAGDVPAFRAAQNQLAAELYLAPLLPVVAGFALTSLRALAMVLDRAFVLGEQGAKRWVADTVGPVRTHAQRRDALAALGYDTVEDFQAAVPGLLTDGEFGPLTHATMAAALRALGARSPVPVLDLQQAVESMARRAAGEDGSARLVRLATAPDVGDSPVSG